MNPFMSAIGGAIHNIQNFGKGVDSTVNNIGQEMHNFGAGMDSLFGMKAPAYKPLLPSPTPQPQKKQQPANNGFNSLPSQVKPLNTTPTYAQPKPIQQAPQKPQQSAFGGAIQNIQNFENTLGKGVQNFTNLFTHPAMQPAQAQQPKQVLGAKTASPTPTAGALLPGENEFVKHMMGVNGGDPNYYHQLYQKAVHSPGFSGQFYGGAKAPNQPMAQLPPPAAGQMRANPNIQPNITIPYSQGGSYTLPSPLAQILMSNFDDIHQATNAAQVLNHPADNPYRPGIDPRSVNHDTRGENASFKTDNIDVPNEDGSIDRGLFRVNSNTFRGIMQHPVFSKIAAQYGINTWEDMNNPQKNAAMARIILLASNYNPQTRGFTQQPTYQRWFAAPHDLRTGDYTPGQAVQMHPSQ